MLPLHHEAYPITKDYTKYEIEVNTLDKIFEEIELNSNILLKLDVQGYEKSVLEGAEKLLSATKLIFMEVTFNPLYKDQYLFNDMIGFLNERGFNIAGIENISQSLVDGTYLQADAYFIKN